MYKLEEMAKIFGTKLKKILEDKNISINKLATSIGLDRASIGKYFKGESSPRIDTFLSICEYLNVQPNYFLNIDYNDYSIDNSKTEERKIIESLYLLCKHGLILKENNVYDYNNPYRVAIASGSFLDEVLTECVIYAKSEFADDNEMCKKISDKYEPLFIEIINKSK